MKTYIEKHDAFICSDYVHQGSKEPKAGELVLHNCIVSNVRNFQPIHTENGVIYREVFFTKDFILGMAEEIKKLEANTIEKGYEPPLPF